MQQPLTKKYHGTVLPVYSFGNSARSQQIPGAIGLPPFKEGIKKGIPRLRDFAKTIPRHFKAFAANHALVSRVSAHLTLILLTALAVIFSNIHLPASGIRSLQPIKQVSVPSITAPVVEEKPIKLTLPLKLNSPREGIFAKAALPHTIVPERSREEISKYVVKGGDTIYGIAYQFGLAPETILWSNPELEDNPHWLGVGQEIRILPMDGIYHQVGGNDTIEAIASAYKVKPEAIINYPLNELDSPDMLIQLGQWLVVPGGRKPFVPMAVTSLVNYSANVPQGALVGTGILGWPVVGRISQGYFNYHQALDIESPIGTAILSVDSGFVAASGFDGSGYGNIVVIDHGNGLQSVYAHLKTSYVDVGDSVSKGQTIGEVGMTGRSTGPHLHLEIRQGSIRLNPISFLP